jgi:hypothetical protein
MKTQICLCGHIIDDHNIDYEGVGSCGVLHCNCECYDEVDDEVLD